MKNITNRLMSGALAINIFALLMSGGVNAFAEGFCSEISLQSLEERVTVDEDADCVYVAAHPSRNEYYISSDELTQNYLSSRKYNLSYVDENMEDGFSENVIGGYVRAEYKKDSEQVYYIPVKPYKGEEMNAVFGENMYTPLSGGSVKSQSAGVGGRLEDSASLILTPPSAGLTEWDSMQHSFSSVPIDNSKTFTAEFSVYAEGDTVLRINCDYSGDDCVFARWKADGTLEADVDGTMTELATLEREKWHRIAVCYDSARCRYALYADGRLITDNSTQRTGGVRMSYGIDVGSSGFAAFSNLKYYYGFYYPQVYFYDRGLESLNENVFVDNENQVIYTDFSAVKSFDELKESIGTDAQIIENKGALTSGSTLMTEDADGIVKYYTINGGIVCEDVDFTNENGTVSVRALLRNNLEKPVNAVMVMLRLNENNAVESVSATEETEITSDGVTLAIENISAVGVRSEVFFLSGWESRLGLLKTIYTD